MKLGEYIFKVKIAWSQLEEVPLLLGRLGVFDRFDVTLKQNDKKVLFEWVRVEDENYWNWR